MRRDHEETVDRFTRIDHRIQSQEIMGRDHRKAIHDRLRAEAIRRSFGGQIDALPAAIARNAEATLSVAHGINDYLFDLKARLERSRERIDRAAEISDKQVARRESGPRPAS